MQESESASKTPLLLFIFACLVYVGLGLHFGPRMPETMATTIGVDGEAVGWSSRASFLRMYWMMGLQLMAIILASGFIPSALPTSIIALPNKDYWLAEERKEATFNWWMMHMLGFGAALMGMFAVVNYLLFRVNLGQAQIPGAILVLVIVFLIFTVVWIVKIFRRFRLPIEE